MKVKKFQSVVMLTIAIIGFFAIFGGATWGQLLPIIVLLILAKKTQDGSADSIWVISGSVVMTLINLYPPVSLIDVVMWSALATVFIIEK